MTYSKPRTKLSDYMKMKYKKEMWRLIECIPPRDDPNYQFHIKCIVNLEDALGIESCFKNELKEEARK